MSEIDRAGTWAAEVIATTAHDLLAGCEAVGSLGEMEQDELELLARCVGDIGTMAWLDDDVVGASASLQVGSLLRWAATTSPAAASGTFARWVTRGEIDLAALRNDAGAGLGGDLEAATRAGAAVSLLSTAILSGDLPDPGLASVFASAAVGPCQLKWSISPLERHVATALLASSALGDGPVSELVQDLTVNLARVVRAHAVEAGDREGCEAAAQLLAGIASRLEDCPRHTCAEHHLLLAAYSLEAFRHGGSGALLERADQAAREAVVLAEPQRRPLHRDVLARVLSARADEERSIEVRREAVAVWRIAVAESDAEAQHHRRLVANLASELALLARWSLDPHVLGESIGLYEDLLASATQTDVLAATLTGLATRYRQRYDLTGDRVDLDLAIEVGERAIDAANDPMQLSTAINNQATRLRRRYEDFAHQPDIDKTIDLHHDAVAALPRGRRERADWIANLAQAHRLRYEALGARRDAVLARWFARGSRRHGQSSVVLNAVATERLEHTNFDRDDLVSIEAIARQSLEAAPPGQATITAQANLAGVLAKLAEAESSLVHARESLQLWEYAIERLPDNHVNTPGLWTGRGATLELLADLTGDPLLVEEAIGCHRRALGYLDFAGHTGQARTITATNLANSLARAGDLLADPAVCDEAYDLASMSATAAGRGPLRYGTLLAAGGAALTRFEMTTDQTGAGRSLDAQRAIAAFRSAVAEVNDVEVERHRAQGNLANALFSVGVATGDRDLLTEAATLYETSTAHGDDLATVLRLSNYGFVALAVAELADDPDTAYTNTSLAQRLFIEATERAGAHVVSSVLDARLLAGRSRAAALAGDSEETRALATKTASALRRLAADRRTQLGADPQMQPAANLSGIGALAMLRAGADHDAINFLESTLAVHLRQRAGRQALVTQLRRLGYDDLADDVQNAVRRSGNSAPDHLDDLERQAAQVVADASDEAAAIVAKRAAHTGRTFCYLVSDHDGGAAIVIRPDHKVSAVDVAALASPSIRRLASRFGRSINNARTPATRLELRHVVNTTIHELSDVVADVIDACGDEPIALIPTGPLRSLPWHAAGDRDGVPWCSSRHVSYLPSATFPGERSDPTTTDVAVLWAGEHARLPAVQEELGGIETVLRRRGIHVASVENPSFDPQLAEQLRTARFLHFAGHAREHWRAGASALMLTAENHLTGDDLLAIGLSAEVTMLSACSTSRPDLLYPDGSYTLANLALIAGSSAVVSAMWPLADHWASRTIPTVYERVVSGTAPVAALAEAVRPSLDTEPFLWASLVVTG